MIGICCISDKDYFVMQYSSHTLIVLALGCLAGSFLAERSQQDVENMLVQRLEVIQQRTNALQEKQEQVMRKLEAEAKAHVAQSSSFVGKLDAEIKAARSALSVKLENYNDALKAELHLLGSPEFAYSNFKKVGEFVLERSKNVGKAIDRMTPILPDMFKKSEDYKLNNFLLQQAVKKLDSTDIPEVRKKVSQEKRQELQDIERLNLQQAFTPRDRQLLKDATADDWKLIKNGEIKQLPEIPVGPNPYADMSSGFEDIPEFHPTSRHQEEEEPTPDVNGIVINIPDHAPARWNAESSLVQVSPHALQLQKNHSHAGQ